MESKDGTTTADNATSEVATGGGTPASTEAAGTGASSVAGADGGSNTWDAGTWDGKPETIHASYRPFYDRVNKDWESKHKEVADDLQVYKDLIAGIGEDPRVTTAQSELAELKAKYEATTKEYEGHKLTSTQADKKLAEIEKAYNALLDNQAQTAAKAFYEKHKEIVTDPAKKQELIALMDDGWDEEAAAQLVGKNSTIRDRAIAIVTEHQLRGSGHRLAVSQAIAELTNQQISSPGALLTSGANGTVSPVRSSERSVRTLSRDDARNEAARIALVHSRR